MQPCLNACMHVGTVMLVAAQHADARILHSPSSPISSRDTPANVHANRCTTGGGLVSVRMANAAATPVTPAASTALPADLWDMLHAHHDHNIRIVGKWATP